MSYERCPKFNAEQVNTLLDTTRRSAAKGIEMGFNLYGNPDDPDLGERCEGDGCTITLPERSYRSMFGSFHTHMKKPAHFSTFDVYTTVARGDTHMCVGGIEDEAPVIRCWTGDVGHGFDKAMTEAAELERRRRSAKTRLEATDLLPEIFDLGQRMRPHFHEACVVQREASRSRQTTLF